MDRSTAPTASPKILSKTLRKSGQPWMSWRLARTSRRDLVRVASQDSCFAGRARQSTAQGLLDHLIRPRQERRRDRQAEGLGGLEVHDQIELCRLLDREVARLAALEDLVHVPGGAPITTNRVRPIGHETAVIDKLPQ